MFDFALLLVPDFALIALGFWLKRRPLLASEFWQGSERLVYFILFPALLFHAVAKAPLDLSKTTELVVVAMTAVALGIVLGWLSRSILKPDDRNWASGVQCAFRFNSYVALAIAGRIAGHDGIALMAVIIGFAVPVCNLFSVYPLAKHSEASIVRELIRNPLILATVGGLLFNLAGLKAPVVVSAMLERLGAASLALGLICVGAGLQLGALKDDQRLAWWLTAVKLLVLPGATLAMVVILDFPPTKAMIAMVFAAVPTASAAFILASRLGGNAAFVAGLISMSTLGSMLTLPLWLGLASSLVAR